MTSDDDPSEMDTDEFLDSLDKSERESSFEADIVLSEVDEMSVRDVPLAEAIRQVAENLTPKAEYVYTLKSESAPDLSSVTMDDDPGTDFEEFTTYGISIRPDMAKKILDRIAQEVEKRESQGYDIDTIVLGTPQYEALEAVAQDDYGGRTEDVFPSLDIIVVPGPQIHAVIDNRRMLIEHLDDG